MCIYIIGAAHVNAMPTTNPDVFISCSSAHEPWQSLSSVGLSSVGQSSVGQSSVGLSSVGISRVGLSSVGLSSVGQVGGLNQGWPK